MELSFPKYFTFQQIMLQNKYWELSYSKCFSVTNKFSCIRSTQNYAVPTVVSITMKFRCKSRTEDQVVPNFFFSYYQFLCRPNTRNQDFRTVLSVTNILCRRTSTEDQAVQIPPPLSPRLLANFNAGHFQKITVRLLMSYIYGAPSKARNSNVVYIWTYVWQR